MSECVWAGDDDGVWKTSCGDTFVFQIGTPEENNFKFCPYCGKQLKVLSGDSNDKTL